MKGIVLATGDAEFHPATTAIAAHLLPVGGKPMIYYPLSMLMMAGIRQVLVMATTSELPHLRRALGDGAHLGIELRYGEAPAAGDVFSACAGHVGTDQVALVRGNNLFHGHAFSEVLAACGRGVQGCRLFSYEVAGSGGNGCVGVGTFDVDAPADADAAITGLHFYDDEVLAVAERVRSRCGWPGIAEVNGDYRARRRCRTTRLGRGFAWIRMDTPSALLQASRYVHTLEHRQGQRIACIEEVALRMGFIDREACHRLGAEQAASSYGRYLMDVAELSADEPGAKTAPAGRPAPAGAGPW